MISGVVVCLHVTGVVEVCLPVFVDGVMSNGKALRYISYTGAPAKKFPDLFSFIFLFVLLVYWAQTCPVGTDTNGGLYPIRGVSSPPSPLVARSLIPQPTEDGGRSVKVLLDGAYDFFISLRGME